MEVLFRLGGRDAAQGVKIPMPSVQIGDADDGVILRGLR